MSEEQRLSEIAARLNAATPGEWQWQHLLSGSGDGKIHSVTGDYIGEAWYECDGLFIAHAPADIRWLLDEVKRLRGEPLRTNPLVASPDAPGNE